MTTLLNTNRILPALVAGVIAALVFGASPAHAEGPLTVDFERDPLFGEVNFLPGDMRDGDVTVTNGTDVAQNIYTESINGFDPDGLGSQLRLRVFENTNPVPIYSDEFDDFLSAGPVPLSLLGAGATKTYTFEVSFIDSADNDYQGKSLGFDLCIGFAGSGLQCGNTVVSDPESVVPPPGGGSGGGSGGGNGGGGGGGPGLAIYNEHVSNIVIGNVDLNNGTATVEWDTNFLSTSQVIYGPTSASYVLDLDTLPNLGYPFGTAETMTKVLHHTMLLTGLSPSQTYVYRVVSRASPPTVSTEHQFSLAFAPPQTGSPVVGGVESDSRPPSGAPNGGTSGGNTLTASGTGGIGTNSSNEEVGAETPNLQLAAALFGLPDGFFELFQSFDCLLVLILILIGLFVAWMLIDAWRGYEESMPPREYRRKQILFFIGGVLLALAYALIFWRECLIIPLSVVLAALLGWFAWHHYSNRSE